MIGASTADLLPCPFCGGAATFERGRWLEESVAIACGNAECRVAPRTEYLLARFADELRAAWSTREPVRSARESIDSILSSG